MRIGLIGDKLSDVILYRQTTMKNKWHTEILTSLQHKPVVDATPR